MGNIIHTTPVGASNVLIHGKYTDDSERPTLPITTYANVLSKPEVVEDITEKIGAPFHLLVTDKIDCADDYIRNLCGHIV